MRMTLRQLAVFVAVAQEGTVTKASDAVQAHPECCEYGFSRSRGRFGGSTI